MSMSPQEFLAQARVNRSELPPDLLPLIVYVEDKELDEYTWNDTNEDFREAVCRELVKDFALRDRALIRYLLEQEIASMDVNESICENARRCVDLLAQLCNVEDALLLWEAKRCSFDSYIGIDGRALIAAGVANTLNYLQTLLIGDEDQDEAVNTLIEEIEMHAYSEHDREMYLAGFEYMWRGYMAD